MFAIQHPVGARWENVNGLGAQVEFASPSEAWAAMEELESMGHDVTTWDVREVEMDGRALTDDERARIRANASGEYVFCSDDASAEQIARAACDADAEWSEDARLEAIRIARAAWDASR